MSRATLAIFTLTLFLGAFLLFCIQPMIARMVLPLLGGSPAVWSTCMVFFQALLLAGYAYAHATTTWLGDRRQTVVQAVVVLLPLLVLPFGVSANATQSLNVNANPTGWLLALLLGVVGLPFFVVSTSAPLLQRWFTCTGHPATADPYFLYAASNLGSMLALLAYPLLLEPNLRLGQQSAAWAAGYGVFVVLTLVCALLVWKGNRPPGPELESHHPPQGPGSLRPGAVIVWLFLAFVPSSLMLGVTSYLTTDVAATPFLWVIPLALYLLTFILTFARRPPLPHSWMVKALPMAAIVLTLALSLSAVTQPLFIPIHLANFFIAAMVCHGELVKHRPSKEHLTAFYLAMSCGGVLGGLFNALVAPVVFDRVAEYPIALVLACLALPRTSSHSSRFKIGLLDWILPFGLGAGAWCAVLLTQRTAGPVALESCIKLVFGLAGLVCYSFKERPLRLALGVGTLFLLGGAYPTQAGRTLYQHRDYFGVLRVAQASDGKSHQLIHGHILHGQQATDPTHRDEPLTYYHRSGPIGQVFSALDPEMTGCNVAVVGLGAGSLACYARSGERWIFYEIDPSVERIARDRRFFSFLDDSRAATTEVILGDARLRLQEAPGNAYKIIVLDAFSSDAIPIHLLTREALRLYISKLAPGGVIALHISNSYIDLVPVLGALARDAGLTCLVCSDLDVVPEEAERGKQPSIWGVMVRSDHDLGGLANDPRWLPASGPGALWTDDYSSIVEHLRWFRR
jgi:spermidine synthase